jgi:adenosylcobinamide kinase/adenosylcobinamide-phosphate guanylyltransferase
VGVKTLILGGVRSGKSRYAGEVARERGGSITLIATGTALDDEMAARIQTHRRARPVDWCVVEEPLHLGAALRRAAEPTRVIIVDCLTLWLSNLLCAADSQQLDREMRELFEALPTLPGQCVLVANEVGLGIMPVNALARRFADEAGVLHQRVGALCQRVVLMVAGLPLTAKDDEGVS